MKYLNKSNFYIIQIIRNFKTNKFENGIFIEYINSNIRLKINIKYYDENKNILIAHAPEINETIILNEEPNILAFKESLNKEWIKWNKINRQYLDNERYDYQPWCYLNLKSLAIDADIINSSKNIDIYVTYDINGNEQLIKSM